MKISRRGFKHSGLLMQLFTTSTMTGVGDTSLSKKNFFAFCAFIGPLTVKS